MVGELATRLSGSSDLYQHNGRRPSASLNFVTCHDGFTLRDLVSDDRKHNEANGEQNRDGRPIHGLDVKDLYWLTPNGTEMADPDWDAGHARCLGMGLMGDQIDETDEHGRRVIGDSFLILFNAGHESVSFRLGGRARGLNWELLLDTSSPASASRLVERLDDYLLQGRTLAVLRPELPASARTSV